jgi:hypothetical protein
MDVREKAEPQRRSVSQRKMDNKRCASPRLCDYVLNGVL